MNPYENLANAIILRAAEDYRKALRRYYKHPEKEDCLKEKVAIEQSFRSGWFAMLTNINPEMLIQKLNKEEVV